MRSTLKRCVVLVFLMSFSVLLFSCASTQPGGMGDDSMYADDYENDSQTFDDPSEEEEVLRLLGITDDEAQTSMRSTPATAETSSTRSRTTSPENRSVEDWQQLEEEVTRLENQVSKKDRELESLRAQLSDQENLIRSKQQDINRMSGGTSTTRQAGRSASVGAETGTSSFKATYQEALALYENRRYEEAIALFRQLLNSGENNGLLDNCQYWIGECYYGMTEYQAALLEFQKVFNYGDSNKLADAQLKTGMCYEKMGNIEQARREYQKLINEYPDSKYVSRAQQYLRQL